MTKYTFEKLANSEKLRTEFFEGMDWLIRSARDKGFTDAALSHAKVKKRLQEELELIIN
ncbi:hypothetical protein [Agrobacterium rosae]|uniref:hypothetical protein n=1 Tax=Agrobacterium rosae TaxID=1972867 RepID=UPI001294A439|nr:hypothetical protein [Agrobacterium rosae]